MADYSKWKVNDLKAELKRRGIAQTGLRLKQQFIDKLEEADAGGAVETGEQAAGEETQGQESAGQETQEQPEQQPEQSQQPEQTEQAEQQPERDEQPIDAPQESKPEEQATAQTQATGVQNGEAESRDEKPTDETPRDEPVTEEEQPEKKADQEQPEKAQEQEQPKESEPPTNEPKTSDEAPSAEEAEDQRKRKRRSQSPVLSAEAVANKKAKAQDESPRVLLPEDREGLSTEEQLAANDAAAPPVPAGGGEEEEARPRKDAAPKQDARFKGLFAGTERELARPVSPPPDTEMKDAEVEPALHAATAALYIGGLMRPLQLVALRNHLISLASAPGSSPNAEVIVDFYLDSIKTHCFARFSSVSAASRVRAALHATVWPNERNRKALFVDFIPESKVQPWIDLEEDSRNRSGPAPRWEVRYNRTDDDSIEATLDEVDPRSATAHTQPPSRGRRDSFQQDGFRAPPSGPRADRERHPPPPPAPVPAESRPSRPGQGFKPLDELFKSTSAKPKLYYLPVSREMADRRLDRFDDLLQKGSFPRRGGDETRRITFEDGDYFVDNGPEFAGGAGGAGRGRRRGRGRGRGGFGGFGGDSWRG